MKSIFILDATKCLMILSLRPIEGNFFSGDDGDRRIIWTSAYYDPENFAFSLEEDSAYEIMVATLLHLYN